MEKYIEKLKHILNNKNKSENIIVALGLILILLFAASYILEPEEQEIEVSSNNVSVEETSSTEARLEQILNQIDGISDTSVMINYSTTDKVVPVYDVKENVDEEVSDGRTSTTSVTEKSVAYQEGENGKVPIVESTELATASGAIVVANGVNIEDNVSKIKEAVSCITGIPVHKISVFEK